MGSIQNLIGGHWVDALSGATRSRFNPADHDEVVAHYPAMGGPDAALALDAASEGARAWRELGALGRGRILLDAATNLRAASARIATDVFRENGKTLAEANAEVSAAAAFLEYYGGLGRGPWGTVLADRRPGVEARTLREPLGIVVLITPWNDPLVTPARKLSPALVAGNTVVLKPASETPLSAYHLAKALAEAGLPSGVLNVLTGTSGDLAPELLTDSRVRAVSFTGSTKVGLQLRRDLADTTARLQTEMGGKNASLVLADADLDHAADTIVAAAFGQTGQRCTATSRVAVEAPVADELTRRLHERATALRVGPGNAEDVQVGPVISEGHLEQVINALDHARTEGGTVRGGEPLRKGDLARGHFLSPAIVTEVPSDSRTWQEEIFGPVLAVLAVDDLENGIAVVNENRYGLSSAVFTRSLTAATQFVHEVDTGQVAVNLPTTGWDVHVPFGGFKDSGSPFKEHGDEGLSFYTRVKSAVIDPGR
jgi:alpha-ketoglutaric semialdehyde dehydrogenase